MREHRIVGLSYIVCIVELSIPVGVDVWIASLIVLDSTQDQAKPNETKPTTKKFYLNHRARQLPFPAPRSFHRIRKQAPKEREKKKRKQEKESKRSLFPTNFVVCAVFYDAVQEREEEKAKSKKQKSVLSSPVVPLFLLSRAKSKAYRPGHVLFFASAKFKTRPY